MARFQWDDSCKVGVSEFDEQHRNLFDYVNRLNDSMQQGKGREILAELIESLIAYTKVHFDNEEKKMKEHGYPGLELHAEEHDELKEKVLAFQEEFNSGKVMISVQIMQFLKDWILSHIMFTDKQYTEFFNEKGLS